MRYQTVLFDFDYTLGDATDSIYEGFCYGLGKLGYPAPDREAVRRTVGHVLEDQYTMVTGDTDPDRRARFRGWFQEVVAETQAEKTKIFPGALELLAALRGRGVRLGVVSSKRLTTLEKILARHGLAPLLDFVTGGERVSRPKPDPEGLNAAVAALGADKAAVLYCGDTVIDAEAAKNAGVDFCAVLNGTTPAEDFSPWPSVHIAPDLPELQTWLGV